MARVGGRNAAFAWFVGVVSTAIVVTLLVIAAPMFPAATGWITEAIGTAQRAIDPDAPASDPTPRAEATEGPLRCRDLYDEASWAVLSMTEGSEVTASTDPPTSTATALVTALEPSVILTCRWSSDVGEISTTVATVPSDAGAVAAGSLPGIGFECGDEQGRTRCVRVDGDLVETIEAADGVWLSTSQQRWHPASYAERVADVLWSRQD